MLFMLIHIRFFSFLMTRPPPISTLFPYTTLFRSLLPRVPARARNGRELGAGRHPTRVRSRSEEHTSELQSRFDLVCRLLLEKKKARHDNRISLISGSRNRHDRRPGSRPANACQSP